MTDVSILAQVRGAVRQFFSSANLDVQAVLGDGGELLVSQTLPERAELVKLGKSWGACIPTGSAFTPVAAWPTTRSELILYNGESANGPSYIVERVWGSLITGGMTGSMVLLGQLVPAPSVVGATGTGIGTTATVLIHQLSGRVAAYGGNAKLHIADTLLPAVANQWFPVGNGGPMAAAIGVGLSAEGLIQGRLIIPPGAALCLNAVFGQASGTAILGVSWHETQMNLG